MKFFYAFFTFYLLFLSVQPCEDFAVSKNEVNHQSSIAQTTSSEQCPESTPDHECSPFCTCSCRQVPVTQPHFTAPAENEIRAAIVVASPVTFQNNYSHQFPDPIWQPPRSKFIA